MQEIAQWRAFLAVARHKNFRAAAGELELSPSALSHSIATLEAELGVRLFHRTTRSVSLSDAGNHLFARISPALGDIAAAVETVADFRATPRGTLRINASVVAARVLMPKIRAYIAAYPDVHIEVVTDERLVDIVATGFDAGVRTLDLVPRDMIAVPCTKRVRYAIVGSPAYIKEHGKPRTPEDLARHACIRFRLASGPIYRWELERDGKTIEVEVSGPLTFGNDALVHEAALDGLGLAYLSEFSAAEDLAAGRLVRVLERWFPSEAPLALYYPQGRYIPASLRAFAGLVRVRQSRPSE
jgi:DNA-binding transcriptional LysR family regulator